MAQNAQKVLNVSLAFVSRTHPVIIMSVHQGINVFKSSACLTSFAGPIMIVEMEFAKEIFASQKDHAKLIKTVKRTRFANKIIASQKMDVGWIPIARSMNLARYTMLSKHLPKT